MSMSRERRAGTPPYLEPSAFRGFVPVHRPQFRTPERKSVPGLIEIVNRRYTLKGVNPFGFRAERESSAIWLLSDRVDRLTELLYSHSVSY